jgi:ABC-type multidrug transport system fused ATPase/permease subunit
MVLFQNFSLSVAGERLTKRLRYRSFKAMLRQETGWFDRKSNSIGALLTRLASDTAAVKGVS